MAKKKQKNWRMHITKPLSLKKSLAGAAFLFTMLSINTAAFLQSPSKQILSSPPQETAQVLGQTTSKEQENQLAYAAFFQKTEVMYWLNIIKEKPAYPDAYRILAVLAYNDHNCQLAQQYISTAILLNPADRALQELQTHITSCTL
jgi:hypothetical protein